jgi:hypothetical protein
MSAARTLVWGVRISAVAALAGAGAALWAFFEQPNTFYIAWLAAFYFWLSMPLGALALLLIWDLTGGRWEPLARLPLSAMAATMPLFAILFLPVIAGLPELYVWSRPEAVATLHNRWYLNPDFFFARVAAYFLIWVGFAAWRLGRREVPSGKTPRGRQAVSAIGLMLLAYSVSFAGIDWIMSTEPDWFSSIYGMVVGSGQFIAALSFALLVIIAARARGRTLEPAFARSLATLAMILLAVVIFWGYVSFCQWLVIWEENLKKEIPWFIERWRDPWGGVIYALVAAHFAVPFFVLVWTSAKRNPILVGSVCGLLLLADAVHVWWLLVPGFPATGFSWIEPAITIGMGGLWVLCLAGVRWLAATRGLPWVRRDEGLIHG